MRLVVYASSLIVALLSLNHSAVADDHPLSDKQRAALKKEFADTVSSKTREIQKSPEKVNAFSRRGDAYFFNGDFKKAVADYETMVTLDPKQDASHWRRGIAYFYAGDYKKAAGQFERYNSYDNIDRENGIWRFFSQAKAYGLEKARKELLKYEKDDREPFPSVYKLFAGKITPKEILDRIHTAEISDKEREKRYFYAYLYIGLNDAVAGKDDSAEKHLRKAVANRWGPKAGFGPNYMWHVGRLHYNLLTAKEKDD